MNLYDANMTLANDLYTRKQFGKALILSLASEVILGEENNTPEYSEKKLIIENFKGHCLLAQNEYDSAIECFDEVINERPGTAEAHAGMAMALWNRGNRENALNHFEQTFNIDSFNRIGVMYYCKALGELNRIAEAKNLCMNYLKQNPSDFEVLDVLLEISGVEEIKKADSDMNIILVTGLFGSGKTTYSRSQGFPVIHADNFFNYSTQTMDYNALEKFKDFNVYCLNDQPKSLVMDAYLLDVDPNLNRLHEAMRPIRTIDVKFVYTDLDELWKSQRSTPERAKNMRQQNLSDFEERRSNQKNQIVLYKKFKKLLADKKINGIDFIFREGNEYIPKDEAHFLEKVGEITDWSFNKNELVAFVKSHESQPYQTIEVMGEIVRPGTEQCWLSWENILKFNIDWKDKYVCDLGSYFGYFSLQALKNGAKKLLGIDQNETLLKVYSEVLKSNKFNNFSTKSIALGNGNNIPDDNYDIILALNMLHHVQRNTTPEYYAEVLESIFRNTKEAVFEINENQVEEITDFAGKFQFTLNKKLTSHRNTSFGQRYLMYFSKKN